MYELVRTACKNLRLWHIDSTGPERLLGRDHVDDRVLVAGSAVWLTIFLQLTLTSTSTKCVRQLGSGSAAAILRY